MYETSRALVFEGTLVLAHDFNLPQIRRNDDGLYHSQYDPGLPILAAPIVAIADALAAWQLWNRHAFGTFAVLAVSIIGVVLAFAILFDLARDQYGSKTALKIVLVAALCTPLWVYARLFFAEGLLAGCLTMAFGGIHRGKVAWASLAFALAILTRAAMVIYWLPLLWLLWRLHRRGLVLFSVLPTCAVLMLWVHNFWRWGNLLQFGYANQGFDTPFYEGVLGLLFAPGTGMLVFALPVFVGMLCWWRWRIQARALADSLLLATVIALLFYGSWWAWHGGWSWGPRFLVPLMPLWMLPLGMLRSKHAWAIIASVGFWVTLTGVFTNVNDYYAAYTTDAGTDYDMLNYSFRASPALGALHSDIETRGLFHFTDIGWRKLEATLLPALLMVGCGIGLVGVKHEE